MLQVGTFLLRCGERAPSPTAATSSPQARGFCQGLGLIFQVADGNSSACLARPRFLLEGLAMSPQPTVPLRQCWRGLEAAGKCPPTVTQLCRQHLGAGQGASQHWRCCTWRWPCPDPKSCFLPGVSPAVLCSHRRVPLPERILFLPAHRLRFVCAFPMQL